MDESGNQIGVFGRVGARPLNGAEQRKMYLRGGRAVDGDGRSVGCDVRGRRGASPPADCLQIRTSAARRRYSASFSSIF